MKNQILRRTLLIVLVLMLGAIGVTVSPAEADWIIRGNYVVTWPSSDSYQTQSVIEDLPDIFTELSFDKGQGFGLDIGYKLNPKLELFLMGIFTDIEGTFVYGIEPGEESGRVTDNNTVDWYTIDFGANYHFTPESRVDFYLGAFVGVFSYDSIKFNLTELEREISISFDDQFSYGLNAGIDVPFTADGPLFFTASVKYMLTDLKEEGGPREIALDPIIGSLGIGFKF